MTKPKTRKCLIKAEGCEISYVQWSSWQQTCRNPACGLAKAKRDREKKEAKARSKLRQEKKLGLDRLLPMPTRLKRAREQTFQPYVRARDFKWFEDMDKEPACIMCGETNPSQWQACHFQSVGSKPELQFHPDNCHLGCHQCNYFANQADTNYEENLRIKIGDEKVDYLKNYNATIRWDVEEVKEIRKHFKSELKRLKDL